MLLPFLMQFSPIVFLCPAHQLNNGTAGQKPVCVG